MERDETRRDHRCRRRRLVLARCAVGERLGLTPTHLDALYYDAEWNPKPPDECARIQMRLVADDRWVIDGNYLSTIVIRLAAADTIVFLDTPPAGA